MRTDNAETGVGWTSDNQVKSNVVGANHSGRHYSQWRWRAMDSLKCTFQRRRCIKN